MFHDNLILTGVFFLNSQLNFPVQFKRNINLVGVTLTLIKFVCITSTLLSVLSILKVVFNA